MKYKIDFDTRANAWCVTIAGQTDVSDLHEVVRNLWQHDDYPDAEVAIWDMSKCAVNFGFDGISGFVGWLGDFKGNRGPYKLALVAPSDIGFGNSRIYAGMQEVRGFEIEVFRDRESVYHWIEELRASDNFDG